MYVKKAGLYKFLNEEFINFFIELFKIVKEAGIEAQLGEPYQKLLKLYEDINKLMLQLRLSTITKQITELDIERDKKFRGLRRVVNGMLCFDEPQKTAAEHLVYAFDRYEADKKNYSSESAALTYFLQQLSGSGDFATDVATLGQEYWVKRISELNKEFDT
jgi:hypothetical protein